MMWTFYLPTKINFGHGCSSSISSLPEIAGRRTAVVTDPVIARLPAVRGIIEQLAPVTVFDEVRPNPTVDNVDALAELLRETDAEVLVAVGGGSALDCAKAASAFVKTGDSSIRAYHSQGKSFTGERIPLVAIPTTAGTGSEVTPIAVLDDEEKNVKAPMTSPLFYPVLAVVDPDLTRTVGMAIYKYLNEDALKGLLSLVMIGVGIHGSVKTLRSHRHSGTLVQTPELLRPVPKNLFMRTILFLGGVVHGMFATGGPFVVIYASKAIPDKSLFRVSICLLWLTLNTVLIFGFTFIDNVWTLETTGILLLTLPFLVAGMLFGDYLHHRVNEYFFRLIVYGVLFVSGWIFVYEVIHHLFFIRNAGT